MYDPLQTKLQKSSKIDVFIFIFFNIDYEQNQVLSKFVCTVVEVVILNESNTDTDCVMFNTLI